MQIIQFIFQFAQCVRRLWLLRTLFFMENWVGSEMAGMKKALFAIFDQPGPTLWPKRAKIWNSFFNCYLAALQPTLGHSQGESLTNQMLIPVFLKVVSTKFLLVYFLDLKESTCETRENVFYFTSKALFFLELIKL